MEALPSQACSVWLGVLQYPSASERGSGSCVCGAGNTLFLLFPWATPAPPSTAWNIGTSPMGVVGIRFTVGGGRKRKWNGHVTMKSAREQCVTMKRDKERRRQRTNKKAALTQPAPKSLGSVEATFQVVLNSPDEELTKYCHRSLISVVSEKTTSTIVHLHINSVSAQTPH